MTAAHPLSVLSSRPTLPVGSGQEALRHPELSIYRCFLPDLTGFIALCRAGPGLQHPPTERYARIKDLEQEFSPARADCGYRAPLVPRLARPSQQYYAAQGKAVKKWFNPMNPVFAARTRARLTNPTHMSIVGNGIGRLSQTSWLARAASSR